MALPLQLEAGVPSRNAEHLAETPMSIPVKKQSVADSLGTISSVLLTASVIAALYFGRELLVPLALAALLTFLLAPLVTRLERWLGRTGSVIFVVIIIFSSTILIGWVLSRQAVDLVGKLPDYKDNIQTKLRAVQDSGSDVLSKVTRTLKDLQIEDAGKTGIGTAQERESDTQSKPMPVEIVDGNGDRLKLAQSLLMPVVGPIGTAGLVFLLLVFMLLQREDLRDRMIRLVGEGHLRETTNAMDDAGSRISRYLMMQLMINVTYGVPLAIGLYFIGVPNALLWGALAAVLRFLPYVGPWIAAAFPILLSLASSPGWMVPLLTLGLFIILELISNNVMEPWLYGSSTGVTPLALIVAALVWTSLWGPVGLVLSAPLTVCLVVMGRHIPKLAFLSILLSDKTPLSSAEDLYQRLLRPGDHDGMEVVEAYLQNQSVSALFDNVLIPISTTAGVDHRTGILEDDQFHGIEQGISDIIADLEDRSDALSPAGAAPRESGLHIRCVPARTRRDALATMMLGYLLRQRGHTVEIAPVGMPQRDLTEWVIAGNPDYICISCVPPTSPLHARGLCARIQAKAPDTRILVGLWSLAPVLPELQRVLLESGATDVATSLPECVDHLSSTRR